MEPHRHEHSVNLGAPRRQAGITAFSFLILAAVFGLVGFGGIKLAPLYLQKLRIRTVLADVKAEFDGTGVATRELRRAVAQRLVVEGLRIDPEDIEITPTNAGYTVGIQYDNRTSYLADIYFLVEVDEQIEIRR